MPTRLSGREQQWAEDHHGDQRGSYRVGSKQTKKHNEIGKITTKTIPNQWFRNGFLTIVPKNFLKNRFLNF